MTNIIRRSPCRKEHDCGPGARGRACGLGAGTLRYERALRYLVSEGALVWNSGSAARRGGFLRDHAAWPRDALGE